MPAVKLDMTFRERGHSTAHPIVITTCIIAGWTGRDRAAVEKHIKELEELGVKRPATTPIYYRVSATRLTTADEIEATGTASSGEAEFVMVQTGGKLWVGVGSDHTDREVETYGVTVSKQMCDKPMAATLWAFDDVADHWDKLLMRSFIVEGGKPVLYQEGSVAAMIDPRELIQGYMATAGGGKTLPEGTVMFCGTFAAKGGIRPSPRFDFELEDPTRGEKIRHGYVIKTLPVLG
jgi:Protein of unknown function (DUF2848)